MGIIEDARGLKLDQLTREELSQLAEACRHFRARRNRADAIRILNMIVSRDQPEPIRSIVESLSDAASGNAGVILTENAIVNGTPIAHSTSSVQSQK